MYSLIKFLSTFEKRKICNNYFKILITKILSDKTSHLTVIKKFCQKFNNRVLKIILSLTYAQVNSIFWLKNSH